MIAFALLVATVVISQHLAEKLLGRDASEDRQFIFIAAGCVLYLLALSWWYVWSENSTPLLAVPYEGTSHFLNTAMTTFFVTPFAIVFNGFAIALGGFALVATICLGKRTFRRSPRRNDLDGR